MDMESMHRRSSAFTETGLEGHDELVDNKIQNLRPRLSVRFRSNVSIVEQTAVELPDPAPVNDNTDPIIPTRVRQQSLLSRIPFVQIALFIAIAAIAYPSFNGQSSNSNLMPIVAQAKPMPPNIRSPKTLPEKRQTTNVDVCKRWSGQSAIVNGTVYYYGGRATTSADQTTNQWSEFG